MINRGQWLLTQPFVTRDGLRVPIPLALLFLAGAVLLVVTWVTPRDWGALLATTASMSVAVPYCLFVAWVLASIPFSNVQGTVFDLLLVPWLAATAWPKLVSRRPED